GLSTGFSIETAILRSECESDDVAIDRQTPGRASEGRAGNRPASGGGRTPVSYDFKSARPGDRGDGEVRTALAQQTQDPFTPSAPETRLSTFDRTRCVSSKAPDFQARLRAD